jgi:peptide-methionine (S)-S-oxide reductase
MENSNQTHETAILAGGCFWCTEAVFLALEGVEKVVPGYIGGKTINPTYKEICTGETLHAEAIKITFNSAIISFETLLEIFFATHDPTTRNRQGNDGWVYSAFSIRCKEQYAFRISIIPDDHLPT